MLRYLGNSDSVLLLRPG
uniref:Uncharacterized protein n=1 Tax=Rhizophora mucronata TaxID=61149 RepID=A0A2P2QJA8_RHIMU